MSNVREGIASPTPAGRWVPTARRAACRRHLSSKLPDAIDFRTGAAMMLQGLTSAYLLRKTLPYRPATPS